MKQTLLKFSVVAAIALWGWFFVVDVRLTAMQRQADQYLAARFPAEAEILYRQVMRIEPWRDLNWNSVAVQYLNRRESDKAIRLLVSLSEEGRLSTDGWLILAEAYKQNGQTEKLESVFQNARSYAKKIDEVTSILQAQVVFYRSQGDFRSALTCQRELAELFVSEPGRVMEEILLQALFNPVAAELEWRSMEDKPVWFAQWGSTLHTVLNETDDNRKWLILGQSYGTAGEWDLAEYSFAKASGSASSYAEAWALLAESRQQQGKDGSKEINRALEIDPGSPAVRLTAALYFRRQSNFNRSIEMLDANIRENPDEPLWYLEMGRTLAEAGRFEDALTAYQQAARKDPKGVANRLSIVQFCVQYNYRVNDIGLPTIQQAMKLSPESVEVLDLMGQVYFALGNYPEAGGMYKRALDMDRDYAPAWLHTAQLALAEGDSPAAKDALEKVTALTGNPTESRLAARLLQQYFPGSAGKNQGVR